MTIFLMFLSAQAVTPTAYPSRDVLAEFAAVCVAVDQADSGKAAAIAAGWREATPEPGSRLANLLAEAKLAEEKEIAKEGPAEILPMAVLAKEVSGRSLALIASGVVIDNITGRGCRIHDLDAHQNIPLQELKSWSGRDPNLYETRAGITRAVWNPGLKTGQMEMEVSFVAPDAPARKHFPFVSVSGLVLIATAIDIKDD